MAGYQRFVAYVYEYRKGKKDSSSGYVRVEARDRKCRVEVHLRCVGLEPGSRCRVYGFVRQEGLMDGILIGSCVTGWLTSSPKRMEVVLMNNNYFDFKDLMAFGMFILALLTFVLTFC